MTPRQPNQRMDLHLGAPGSAMLQQEFPRLIRRQKTIFNQRGQQLFQLQPRLIRLPDSCVLEGFHTVRPITPL